jgi:hypothetical protein
MGFVLTYKHLADLIPKDWTVVDLGCAYNPQNWYFRRHHKYIAVDNQTTERFVFPNTELYHGNIETWISEHQVEIDPKTTFAILNYVPSVDAEIVKSAFENLYIFYPFTLQPHIPHHPRVPRID